MSLPKRIRFLFKSNDKIGIDAYSPLKDASNYDQHNRRFLFLYHILTNPKTITWQYKRISKTVCCGILCQWMICRSHIPSSKVISCCWHFQDVQINIGVISFGSMNILHWEKDRKDSNHKEIAKLVFTKKRGGEQMRIKLDISTQRVLRN